MIEIEQQHRIIASVKNDEDIHKTKYWNFYNLTHLYITRKDGEEFINFIKCKISYPAMELIIAYMQLIADENTGSYALDPDETIKLIEKYYGGIIIKYSDDFKEFKNYEVYELQVYEVPEVLNIEKSIFEIDHYWNIERWDSFKEHIYSIAWIRNEELEKEIKLIMDDKDPIEE